MKGEYSWERKLEQHRDWNSQVQNTPEYTPLSDYVEIKKQDILTVFRKQQEEKAIAEIKENSKFFYKYAAKYSKRNQM